MADSDSSGSASWYRWDSDSLILDLRVQPGASRDKIDGLYGDRLKVRITSPPVDGKANQHLIAYFARLCGVAKSRITLLAGPTGRNKRLRIDSPRKLPEGVLRPTG